VSEKLHFHHGLFKILRFWDIYVIYLLLNDVAMIFFECLLACDFICLCSLGRLIIQTCR